MIIEWYVFIVALVAIGYSLLIRFIQSKLIDRKSMEAFQKQSKELQTEFDKAKKRNDKAQMDKITQQQLEAMPQMQKMFSGQMKMLVVVLGIFFSVQWVLNHFDPHLSDDFVIYLKDDGNGCDKAVDGIFTACQVLNNSQTGEWSVNLQAFNSETPAGERIVYFLVGSTDELPPPQFGTLDAGLNVSYCFQAVKIDAPPLFGLLGGKPTSHYLNLSEEKRSYQLGDMLIITAKPENAKTVKATFDNGSSLYVDLPFTVPFFNTSRIRTVNTWFISVAFVVGLLVSLIQGQFKRLQKQSGGPL